MAALGVLPSFTAGTVYLSGQYVIDIWGKEREGLVMPAKSFLELGVPVTINTDYPAGAGASLFLRRAPKAFSRDGAGSGGPGSPGSNRLLRGNRLFTKNWSPTKTASPQPLDQTRPQKTAPIQTKLPPPPACTTLLTAKPRTASWWSARSSGSACLTGSRR
jgi:hypothetical protein